MKLSFAYDIPYQFPENTNIIGGEKALLKQRTDLLVKYLNNQCTYKDIAGIDEKIKDQRDTNDYHGNKSLFSQPSLVNYDANFLTVFAKTYLNIDAYQFFKNVPIFEIENVEICAYMPEVDKFGNIKRNNDKTSDITVAVEITYIDVDITYENSDKYYQQILAEITKTIPNARAFEKRFICKVDEYCDIFTEIEEGTNETKLYGYHDTPISPLEYEIQQIKTTTNQKFARRLYCGKIWTHNGLCFTKRYYGIDN
jgi:hypothetical protein